MKSLRFVFGPVITMAFLVLAACELSEDNKIALAQACLDSATPATANNCRDLVSGIEKPEAYGIKCAADFIANGITTSRITNAVSKMLDGVAGASNPAAVLMLYISFPNTTASQQALDDCNKSGSKGYQFFATAAHMGTTIGEIANTGILTTITSGGTPTGTEIQNAVSAVAGNSTAQTVVGSTARTMYSTQCSALTAQNRAICSTIASQLNSGASDQALGAALLTAFQNPPP